MTEELTEEEVSISKQKPKFDDSLIQSTIKKNLPSHLSGTRITYNNVYDNRFRINLWRPNPEQVYAEINVATFFWKIEFAKDGHIVTDLTIR